MGRADRTADAGLALAVSILACWRVSHLVAHEDGPFDVVLRVRARAGLSPWGRLMDCPYCLSMYAAAPLAGWVVRRSRFAVRDAIPLWLAISGGASVVERVLAAGPDPVEVLAGAVDPGA
jgi:hypothetical protein